MNLKNLFISVVYTFIFVLGLSLIFSTLNYFNIIKDNLFNVIKILIPVISIFIGAFRLGKKAEKKGWLEGIKLGSIVILLMFIFSLIFFRNSITLKTILYYFILLVTAIVSSMVGISFKKIDN